MHTKNEKTKKPVNEQKLKPKKLKHISVWELEKHGWPIHTLPSVWRVTPIFIEVNKKGEPRYEHGNVYTLEELKQLELIKLI